MLNSVPHVAQDEAQKVDLFEKGLHRDVYHIVHSQRAPILDAAIGHTQWIDRGSMIMSERDGAPETSSGKRHPVLPNFGQSSGSRHISRALPSSHGPEIGLLDCASEDQVPDDV